MQTVIAIPNVVVPVTAPVILACSVKIVFVVANGTLDPRFENPSIK